MHDTNSKATQDITNSPESTFEQITPTQISYIANLAFQMAGISQPGVPPTAPAQSAFLSSAFATPQPRELSPDSVHQ